MIHLHIPHMLHALRILMPLRDNFVPAQLRPQPSPARPVHNTKQQHAHAHNRKHVVRVPVRVPCTRWRDEGDQREEDVGGEIQHRDGEPGVPRGFPPLGLVVVQVDETRGDEAVDPGAGIGVQVRDEVVGGAGGGRDKDDDGDEPVEEEGGGRRAEGLDGCPELAVRKETLLREFLVQARVGEADGKHVAEIGQGDEGGQTARACAVAEDVAEEDAGYDGFAAREVFFGDRGEVGDVGKDVEDGGAADG